MNYRCSVLSLGQYLSIGFVFKSKQEFAENIYYAAGIREGKDCSGQESFEGFFLKMVSELDSQKGQI